MTKHDEKKFLMLTRPGQNDPLKAPETRLVLLSYKNLLGRVFGLLPIMYITGTKVQSSLRSDAPCTKVKNGCFSR